MRWRRITADGRCDKGGKRPAGDVRPWSESARSLPHPLLHLPRWVTPYDTRRWLTFRPREADWRDCISDRLHPDLPIFFPLPDYQSAGQRQLCRSRRIPLPDPTSICGRLQQAFRPGQGGKEERLYEERRRAGVVGKVSLDPLKRTQLTGVRFSGLRSVLSGPAGGFVGCALTAYSPKRARPVIGFDMGGTSTDVCRFPGQYELSFESVVANIKIACPQLSIETVAA